MEVCRGAAQAYSVGLVSRCRDALNEVAASDDDVRRGRIVDAARYVDIQLVSCLNIYYAAHS